MDRLKYYEYLSDEARNQRHEDMELQALAANLRPGVLVRYWSVGRYENPEWGDRGIVLEHSATTGLTRVQFDGETEPVWMDGRRLHIEQPDEGCRDAMCGCHSETRQEL